MPPALVEIISVKPIRGMGYLHDFRGELERMLAELEPDERAAVIAFVTDKVYESYKNGRAEGSREEPRKTASPKVKRRRDEKR